MKAAVYYEGGPPDVLRYEEIPDPELTPDGVLIQVAAIGVQAGDTLRRNGAGRFDAPQVTGYQASGEVVAVGDAVTRFRPGDRVVEALGSGSHAELVVAPEMFTYSVPDGMDLETAAAVPVEFGTAHDCLFEFGHLQSGETVLIQAGASGVGLAAIQLAKRAGAITIATASSDDRLGRLADYGLDHGINYRDRDFAADVMEITDGRGADLIVDVVGGSTLERGISALAYLGRIVWAGNAGREDYQPNVWPIMQKNGSLVGMFLGEDMRRRPERVRPMIEGVLDRVADGELRVAIEQRYALADAAEAHRFIESRRAFGRVLIIP